MTIVTFFLLALILLFSIEAKVPIIHMSLFHPRKVHHSIRHGRKLDSNTATNYIRHTTKTAVGANLGRRLNSKNDCVAKCDKLGYACAGFIQETKEDSTKCTLVGRGYGLQNSPESDFYRKKNNFKNIKWEKYSYKMVPSPHIHAWHGINGSVEEIRDICVLDSQCQGFYTCNDDIHSHESCKRILIDLHDKLKLKSEIGIQSGAFEHPADAILLSGVPNQENLLSNSDIVIHARHIKTCGGTSNGAPCDFPFTAAIDNSEEGVLYYEPTIIGSDRPWCYTTKPGRWGYVDCYGQDILGLKWDVSNWTTCPVTCGGAMRTRTVVCRNTTSNEILNKYMCGASPDTSEPCNTHSCNEGCNIEQENRRACGAFYEDPRSGYDSATIKQDACSSYGCCWANKINKGYQCYKSVNDDDESGCKFGYDGKKKEEVTTATNKINVCGDSCCRGDTVHGDCAWSLGYAKKNSCNRYAEAAVNNNLQEWFYHGPDKYAICKYIEAGMQISSKSCKTACKAKSGCNSVNYHEEQKICELLDCGVHRSPPELRKSIGYGVYVWESSYSRKWKVAPWGDCQVQQGESIGAQSGSECLLKQTRDIVCIDKNGDTVTDADCFKQSIKPEGIRTCYGACGVTKSCEQLAWEHQDRQKYNNYGIANYKICGSSFVGGPYIDQYYDHQAMGRMDFTGCWAPKRNDDSPEVTKTFQEAKAECETVGARLCTLSETLDGVTGTAGKGKSCMGNFYWTSTSCGPNNEGIFVAGRGSRGNEDIIGKECAKADEKHLFGCCSEWATTDFQAEVDAIRISRGSEVMGTYDHCNNEKSPCRKYEGHCRFDHDCKFGSMCADLAGPKYGMPEGSGACIPKYDTHQFSYWPLVYYKGQPTDMIILERGKGKLPDNAIVRIVKGNNPGCMGVWDYSVPIAAEAMLKKEGNTKPRPDGWPAKVEGHCSSSKSLEQDLPYNTKPYMKWRNLILDGQNEIPNSIYKETRNHVCFCDNATNCDVPINWHDLGRIAVEPATLSFEGMSSLAMASGIGYGADLFESYRSVDMHHYYPDLKRMRFTVSAIDDSGNEGPISQVSVHKEFCAQRCLANPLCAGFDYFDEKGWSSWTHPKGTVQKVCRLRGEGARIRIVSKEYAGDTAPGYWFKKEKANQIRRYWNWFPSHNFASAGVAKDRINPTVVKACHRRITGINKTHITSTTLKLIWSYFGFCFQRMNDAIN